MSRRELQPDEGRRRRPSPAPRGPETLPRPAALQGAPGDVGAEEASLLEAAKRGDARAVEALVERHEAQVYRFAAKMCRDSEDARDVTQDTLLAMARSLPDFRGASSLSTWLYTIARRFCGKRRRRAERAEPAPLTGALAEQVPDPGRVPDEALAGRQVERALDEAIRSLEPMYRDVLVLRDVEGLTAPQVAEILGVRVDAVKSRLHRARVAVRDRLAPVMGVPALEPAAGCPDVLRLFSRHVEGGLSAGVCARMERHLQGCARCRDACDSLKHTLALCRASAAAPVPDEVVRQLRAALRGFLAQPPEPLA